MISSKAVRNQRNEEKRSQHICKPKPIRNWHPINLSPMIVKDRNFTIRTFKLFVLLATLLQRPNIALEQSERSVDFRVFKSQRHGVSIFQTTRGKETYRKVLNKFASDWEPTLIEQREKIPRLIEGGCCLALKIARICNWLSDLRIEQVALYIKENNKSERA